MELVAYDLTPELRQRLVPSGGEREWMQTPEARYGRRCLPLMMANRAGWDVLLDDPMSATWAGTPDAAAMTIDGEGEAGFGSGVLTFRLRWLFRTPPGWNLLVRGPANAPKDGIGPLEGLIETDWTHATFTMNWKFTRPGTVRFAAGEPICTLVPQRRGELEAFRPRVASIGEDPAALDGVRDFASRRAAFMEDRRDGEWQLDYLRGRQAGGTERFPEHQRTRRLRPFV